MAASFSLRGQPLGAAQRQSARPWLAFGCARTIAPILIAPCTPRSRRRPDPHARRAAHAEKGTTMQANRIITADDLRQFTGTANWHRHGIVRGVLFTDGAKFLADHAGAYWLLDEIAFGQRQRKVAVEGFQLWRLSVDLGKKAGALACEDGDEKTVYRKLVPYTDFPLAEIVLYFVDGVILLPSEY
ncbi:DUF6876 family protein [Methylosinus sp. KRF6]|uniref:DUF6876 family protein n=1 Tax=Methylosinus sp. KRF6 TaxID=2846853 RepID=UPI001C0CA5A0|nr:DUF6876 family protein [Methylosinus sp. KRF6]MBU3888579.1 hypothetical protein [Methylosinus sp. KRF6]